MRTCVLWQRAACLDRIWCCWIRWEEEKVREEGAIGEQRWCWRALQGRTPCSEVQRVTGESKQHCSMGISARLVPLTAVTPALLYRRKVHIRPLLLSSSPPPPAGRHPPLHVPPRPSPSFQALHRSHCRWQAGSLSLRWGME